MSEPRLQYKKHTKIDRNIGSMISFSFLRTNEINIYIIAHILMELLNIILHFNNIVAYSYPISLHNLYMLFIQYFCYCLFLLK